MTSHRSPGVLISALAAAVQLLPAASSAQEADVRYLASPGAPEKVFPRFEGPVAEIVSPRRSTEVTREANQEAQQLARLMGLTSGMVVGDIGAGAGTTRGLRDPRPHVSRDRRALRVSLQPRASLSGIVDLDRPTQQHGTSPELLRCELAAIGYRELSLHTLTGDAGYLAIFVPPVERPRPSALVPCRP